MNNSTLQIKNVEVEGFGNLGHVIMRELGNRIVLEGVNGVGKTMILMAIRAALEGKTGLPDRPLAEFVKDGYESAVIKVDLADGSSIKFSIRVTITADNFDLQVKEVFEDGKARKIPGGPVAFLKTIVNAIAFRPQQWRKKSDAEQLEEVFNFFPGLKDKLTQNDTELTGVEQERAKMLNRSKVLRLDIDRAPFTPNLPEQEIDPAELTKKLVAASDHNKKLEGIKREAQDARNEISHIDEDMKSVEAEKQRALEMIAKLQEQVRQSEVEIERKKGLQNIWLKTVTRLDAEIAAFAVEPVETIEKEITGVNEKNKAIRENARIRQMNRDLEDSDRKANEQYKKSVALKDKRAAIMASAEIPVEGLSIGDQCLLYPNTGMEMVRLSALSDGEFWAVACGLVAAFNPRVRIMIIDNMHDLDKTNFETLCAAATKHGMQIWIHKTLWDEKDAGAGFLIRDGSIVNQASGEITR